MASKVPLTIVVAGATASSESAQALGALPGVTVVEKDWKMVDEAWLREQRAGGDLRAFIASHNGISQFTDEGLFLAACLAAGVEYVVRISTTQSVVGPDSVAYYGRSHWAAEAMLATPEFKAMKWTSLQPNVFTQQLASGVVAWLAQYRTTGRKGPFKIMLDGKAGVAAVDCNEVGALAARLLALSSDNVQTHTGQKYVVVGPSNVSGGEVVALLEKHAGTTVDEIEFRDVSWAPYLGKMIGLPENVIPSLARAPSTGYEGACSVEQSPCSPGVVKLGAPVNGALEMIDAALADV
ncbi:hypothetical protein CspeluHIS016_0402250 [Cutaneotrichosporon spelunceum]|uniref:NmrA-like domain-containing protein n=1 Tax=Cutaneotrichosporon spelunceum TaxID=1672016 RepID=A0AAD3TVN2_9TREE|nr:hypothetical protein CspeluHIS016_0402250 [Cutaneotrichosporon spelunceum]